VDSEDSGPDTDNETVKSDTSSSSDNDEDDQQAGQAQAGGAGAFSTLGSRARSNSLGGTGTGTAAGTGKGLSRRSVSRLPPGVYLDGMDLSSTFTGGLRDVKGYMSTSNALDEYRKRTKQALLGSSIARNTIRWLEGKLKALIKSLISMGVGLSTARELRDLFEGSSGCCVCACVHA
jgi:hypothetical protein